METYFLILQVEVQVVTSGIASLHSPLGRGEGPVNPLSPSLSAVWVLSSPGEPWTDGHTSLHLHDFRWVALIKSIISKFLSSLIVKKGE